MSERQEDALKLWKRKKAEFERELAITASPALKFELKQRISECKQELEKLKKNYESENQILKVSNVKVKNTYSKEKTGDSDVSLDELFHKNNSPLSKFFRSIFEDN